MPEQHRITFNVTTPDDFFEQPQNPKITIPLLLNLRTDIRVDSVFFERIDQTEGGGDENGANERP